MSEEEKQVKSYSESSTTSSVEIQNWIEAQNLLKKKLIKEDDLEGNEDDLKYVGGADISFLKEDSSVACGTLVVMDVQTLQVVYDDFSLVTVQVPYVPGFLAFREAPVLLELLERMKKRAPLLYPQLLMVDGNGILHPRGFGLASHLGVLANLPTIGIGKNLHHVDGLTQTSVRQLLSEGKNHDSIITLKGISGCIWGVAMRSTVDSLKPIYVSIGHRVSLDTAIKIVKITCKYRVPEPIRQVKRIPQEISNGNVRKNNFIAKGIRSDTQTRQIAARKEEQTKTLRTAFGLGSADDSKQVKEEISDPSRNRREGQKGDIKRHEKSEQHSFLEENLTEKSMALKKTFFRQRFW